MAILHEATREVICKIVYHGAGRSGKTTSLLYMNHHLPAEHRGQFVSLETPTERTLFFDLLPVTARAGDWKFRYLLFATPGQEYYHASRRLILKGADAIVFVVDSQRDRAQDNWEALELLDKNLRELGQRPDALPMVLQYNKRDLPSAMPLDDAERRYNARRMLSFPAIARTGQGVYETFLNVARMALTRLAAPAAEAQMGELFRSVVVGEDDAERLTKLLARLNEDAGASGSLLVDESSAILAAAGRLPAKDPESLGALLASNFAAAQELAGTLSGSGFTGTIQKGAKLVLRAARIDARRFVVLGCPRGSDPKRTRDAMVAVRGPLAAQLELMGSMAGTRLGRMGEAFGAVTRLAIAGLAEA